MEEHDKGSSAPPTKIEAPFPITAASEPSQPDHDVMDGWRGWVVVGAASCSLFVYLGIIYSWGVLQVKLLESASSSLTTLTFVGSLATSFMVSSSIPVGLMIRRWGYQRTALAGAVLMGLGEFLASWVTEHVGALFVTHGIIFGVGGGLTILTCSTAPMQWFEKHRGLAVGIVFGGGSLGSAIMSIATNMMVKQLPLEWIFRVLAFLLWGVCAPAACLIRQPSHAKNSVPRPQWYRFREKEFLILFVGTGLACFPLFVPPYFIPIFARSVTHSQNIAVIMLAIWNVASTVGRVVAGFLSDSVLGPINSLILSLTLAGISALAIWPFSSTTAVLSVFIVLNGFGCGAFFSLVPSTIGAMFGGKNTLGILPIIWAGWFVGFFFGSPIASGIYSLSGKADNIESYRPAAYYAGAMSIVGLLFTIVLRSMYSTHLLVKV
ncbi:monocarboxylate transporter [Aspergillus nomiae NRRL 13137]|uniref:Monocarboxylate transporter n=1 Tax=Aspergillus nomiae NRRL (strain ATCC 15546 / NRRL 13137 / CBS 260.88 / M93) TaxID=1509407 RepID=A0A0L1IWN9_ASPN3|nr:monocarboxylate transporter [Aspergillus nomiae NRRL 13137]KNG83835.1 monocarboxylate transporter [Aspergillus nomiae NRRL 13137]